MKKTIIYLIHFIYWVFYLGVVSFVVVLMLKFQKDFNVEFYFKLTFFSPFAILVFVSAFIGFYVNYSFLFVKYYLALRIFPLVELEYYLYFGNYRRKYKY